MGTNTNFTVTKFINSEKMLAKVFGIIPKSFIVFSKQCRIRSEEQII